jgi:hypothetical protein
MKRTRQRTQSSLHKGGLVLLAGLVVGGLAWAQSGLLLSGRLLGYGGQAATVWATFDASGDPEAAVQVGSIERGGKFRLELPASVPDELLETPQFREDCGEATPGLKLAVLADVYVKHNQDIVGSAFFANRRASLDALLSGQLEGSNKVGLWFYANRAGKIVEDCDSPERQEYSNVTFQPGWNAVTGFLLATDKPRSRIVNGHTVGLMRWFFVGKEQQ